MSRPRLRVAREDDVTAAIRRQSAMYLQRAHDAEAERDRLAARVAELEARGDSALDQRDAAWAEIETLQNRVGKLAKALEFYGERVGDGIRARDALATDKEPA